MDLRGEVLEAPPFADFAPRRAFKDLAFKDLAKLARVAESITDAAPKQTKQQKISYREVSNAEGDAWKHRIKIRSQGQVQGSALLRFVEQQHAWGLEQINIAYNN